MQVVVEPALCAGRGAHRPTTDLRPRRHAVEELLGPIGITDRIARRATRFAQCVWQAHRHLRDVDTKPLSVDASGDRELLPMTTGNKRRSVLSVTVEKASIDDFSPTTRGGLALRIQPNSEQRVRCSRTANGRVDFPPLVPPVCRSRTLPHQRSATAPKPIDGRSQTGGAVVTPRRMGAGKTLTAPSRRLINRVELHVRSGNSPARLKGLTGGAVATPRRCEAFGGSGHVIESDASCLDYHW